VHFISSSNLYLEQAPLICFECIMYPCGMLFIIARF